MPYIASTMACSQDYVSYEDNPAGSGANVVKKRVTVEGGHGVAQKGTANVYTPDGVVTAVSDEDLEFLQSNIHFQKHLAGGYLKVLKSKSAANNVSTVAADMNQKDASAPLTEKDSNAGGRLVGAKLHKKEIK